MPLAIAPRLTRRALLRLGGGLSGLAGLSFLAACGRTPTPQAVGMAPAVTPPPPTATTAIQAIPSPSATIAATPTIQPASAVPSAAIATTIAPATTTVAPNPSALPTAPTAASPAVAATMTLPLFNGIPQGRTTDGFPFLGNPDVAVTVIDYSDFL